MPNEKLRTQIIEWLQTQPYWLQYAGQQILQNGTVTSDAALRAYTHFKQDSALEPIPADRPEIGFVARAEPIDDEGPLVLEAIKNALNVNAIAAGQSIPLGPQLNLIYGGNGVGKSGYIRVLNNAFSSRGDRVILPNVFNSDAPGPPSCEFTFKRTEEPYDLKYSDDATSPEFSQFCVFDTVSVRAHLDSENTLSFTPAGFEFFEMLLEFHSLVKQMLSDEIVRRRPQNTFLNLFPTENEVRTFISDLCWQTDSFQLDQFASFSVDHQREADQIDTKIAELRQVNRLSRLQHFQALSSQLDALQANVERIFETVSEEKCDDSRNVFTDIRKFEELSRSEGLQTFEKFDISEIGSPEWRAFIGAGREYAAKVSCGQSEDYPGEGNDCLFCLQPLQGDSPTLIANYWKFLKGTAELELADARRRREVLTQSVQEVPTVIFDTSTQLYGYMEEALDGVVEQCRVVVDVALAAKTAMTAALTDMNPQILPAPQPPDLSPFQVARDALEKEKENLVRSDPEAEITALLRRKAFLEDKRRLQQIKNQIAAFIDESKWVNYATAVHQGTVTNSITIAQGRLYQEHVTDEYLNTFSKECAALNAPPFIHVSQRNERGTTLRKLKVREASAMKILSEGEQRAIGLADFITEARLNPTNRGVVFDDPVSSQDHLRRSRIANRIAELAKIRQVIVFTHDIAFFIELRNAADATGVAVNTTTIRRVGDTPGIVNDQLPWIVQPLKSRVKLLRDRLVQLKKIEASGNEDEYLFAVKSWYGLLREAWERAVEERLFKGVIERFSPGIQTQKLKNVSITEDLLGKIEKGMTAASQWVHDSAAVLNPTPPGTSTAETHLQDLDDFVKECPPP